MFNGDERCLLSHPALPHNLSTRFSSITQSGCFTCGRKYIVWEVNFVQYYCTTCRVEFHTDCHKRPRRITHPYHLQHPLTLFYRDPETGTVSNIIPDASPSEPDIFDEESSDTSDQGQPEFVDIVPSKSDIIFEKCTWCGKEFKGDWFYRCLICSFCLDLPCVERLPPLTIPNPKGHQHSLLFLPRPLLVPCDVCGLVDALEPSYTCFQCNYMAHQRCIDLPRVIKITRHPHRLHYIQYRSPLSCLCRICYKQVDVKYGQYSCNQEDCSYVVHSRCATHKTVWDGKELEWEPEETEEEEDIAPFKKLGDGFIEHFGHRHPLKLKKHDGGVVDTERLCEACVYPIVSPQFYHCELEGCNYYLHEVCAGLPRKLDHALHNHTLILDPSPLKYCSNMSCSVCFRETTGFRYKCSAKGCRYFWADVRCISVQECFVHKSHDDDDHPVFISTSHSGEDEIICKGCEKICSGGTHLHCTVCEFALCYACGTIPHELHYKYDKHPLTLSYGEEKSDEIYWCEVCEKLLDTKEWFYTCDQCCTTVHLHCLFGSSFFMKPGTIFWYESISVEVIRNSSNTRQLCYRCRHLCTCFTYYQVYDDWLKTQFYYNDRCTYRAPICSLHCLMSERW